MACRARRRRAFAFDQFSGQPLGLGIFTANHSHHRFHGGDAEAEFWLANRCHRHAEIFRREHVAEPDQRDVLGNPPALGEQGVRAADGHEVADGLHGGGLAAFVEHLQGGLRPIFDRAAGLEHEFVVHLESCFAQGAAISLETFMRPWRGRRAGEIRDLFVAEFDQMLRGVVARHEFLDFHAGEGFAESIGRSRGNRAISSSVYARTSRTGGQKSRQRISSAGVRLRSNGAP